MQQYTYDIVIQEDGVDPGYVARVPALPGCFGVGDSVEEAVEDIKKAIPLYLEALIEQGEPIPGNARVMLTAPLTVELAA